MGRTWSRIILREHGFLKTEGDQSFTERMIFFFFLMLWGDTLTVEAISGLLELALIKYQDN